MSDRVAVFESGAIVQLGTPDGLYNEPATAFVAGFIGENNLLDGVAERVENGRCLVALSADLKASALAIGDIAPGMPVQLAIRPERIAIGGADDAGITRFRAAAEGRIYLGDHQRLLVRLGNGQELMVKVGAQDALAAGEIVDVYWQTADCRAFPSVAARGRT
jgi:putative spermidine/putrescine transport system ATP-binding protein